MHEIDARSEARVPSSQKGVLRNKDIWSRCLIQDVSSKGFMILCDYKSAVGDMPPNIGEFLNLNWFAGDDEIVYCRIQVRHITDGYFGALVIDRFTTVPANETQHLVDKVKRRA